MKGSVAAFGHDKLGPAFLANISLSNLICHLRILLPLTCANFLCFKHIALRVRSLKFQLPNPKFQ